MVTMAFIPFVTSSIRTTITRAILATLMITLLLQITPAMPERSCYVCDSRKSLADCEMTQYKEIGCGTIDNSTSSCYIVENPADGRYGKHCIHERLCNKQSICSNKKDCELFCCKGDHCNKSKFSSSVKNFGCVGMIVVCLFLSGVLSCWR